MSALVFVGPTLEAEAAREALPGGVFLPPARQGDVFRAASVLRPAAIGIVDGYFRQAPAVWHKEILWCLSEGIAVFGAASMGALRAAELASFGMRGVGRIHDAYVQGVFAPFYDEAFEDDDEVAVAHAPAEAGYIASEALVNIRATLASAHGAGVIGRAARDALVALAKSTFFPRRSFASLLERAGQAGLDGAMLDALREWLPRGRVDQKREDAVEMLRLMAGQPGAPPGEPDFHFERTSLWQRVEAELSREADPADPALDELRLDAPLYRRCRGAAVLALLALDDAAGELPPLRAAAGLDPHEEVLARLADGDCGEQDARRILHREIGYNALRFDLERTPPGLLRRHLRRVLEREERLAPLEARSRAKREALAAAHGEVSVDDLDALQRLDLGVWYFREILGAPFPASLEEQLPRLGFESLHEFHRVALDERLYRELDGGAP